MSHKPVYYFSKHNENSIKLLSVLKNYSNQIAFVCVEDYYAKHRQMPHGCRGCPSLLVYDMQTNRPQMYEGAQRIQTQLNAILSSAVAAAAPAKVPEVPKFLQQEGGSGKEQFDWAAGVAPAPLDGSCRPSETKAPFTVDVKKGSDSSNSNADQLRKYQEASAQWGITDTPAAAAETFQREPAGGGKSKPDFFAPANAPAKSSGDKPNFFKPAK